MSVCNNNATANFEDETLVIENAITYREKSPFGKHYEIIHMNCKSFIKNDQDISQEKDTNSCLFPGIIEFLLTYYMPLLPLWSGIILCTVNTGNVTTDSNASVENWFRIVKHNIFDTDSWLKSADFIRSIYINIDNRIAAFKFSFSRLAGKVLKQKKRKCQVENEEECKEEWSKRKKNKFSYIQPSKSRIDKALKGIIKGKSNSLKTVKCRNKQIVIR